MAGIPKYTTLPLPATPPNPNDIKPEHRWMYDGSNGMNMPKQTPAPAVQPSVPTAEMRMGTPYQLHGRNPVGGAGLGAPAPVAPAQAPGELVGPTQMDKYDVQTKAAYDRQVPFQPANVFSDGTSGTGAQHMRPTGWVQDDINNGHVSLPRAQSGNTAPAAAPTFGGMSATEYLADAKARDAQVGVDAETRRLAHAREIDMNTANYNMGRAQGINGDIRNPVQFAAAAGRYNTLEKARLDEAKNTTELAKTDRLVAGDLQKTDLSGQYALQEADLTGQYGLGGARLAAEAAGLTAQAGLDKARITANGTVQAAQIKAAPTGEEMGKAQLIQAKLATLAAAAQNGDTETMNALLVNQLPRGATVKPNPLGGFLFVDPSGRVRELGPAEMEALAAQSAAQQ